MTSSTRVPDGLLPRRPRRPWRTAVVVLGLLAVGVSPAIAPSAAAAAPSAPPSPAGQRLFSAPDAALGAGWGSSSDVLVSGVGDTDGFHLYAARERNAYAWTTLATLTASSIDVGPWTGEVCVTGSGRYAVAVYAPAAAANQPALLQAGAMAAVVDTATGTARQVASGVELAYFNPACGPGDRVLLTRSIGPDEQQTDLLTVDAAAGKVTSTRRVNAQLTNPVPASDGDYGVVHGGLARVGGAGQLTTVARPAGRPVAVVATARHGIDLVSVAGDRAVAQRFTGGRLSDLGSAAADRLQLFGLTGGRDALVGDTASVKVGVPEQSRLPSAHRALAVSTDGHLLAEQELPAQLAQTVAAPLRRPDPRLAGPMRVTVRAARTGQVSSTTVVTTHASTLNVLPRRPSAGGKRPMDVNTTDPTCAIPRNDPAVQAFQPSPDMVEWAVDQAVHNRLTITRPANYLKTGMPAYKPQIMFPLHAVAGGGSVPAQLLLGILAQETNLSEASWHGVPGDDANPLIADYYGNGGNIDAVNFGSADCGYGIGQVTDGMHKTDTQYTHAQQVAIATDYAANIAAGINILIDKWNQLRSDPAGPTYVNNGDANVIENWYLAVWAYNSGYHAKSESGQWHGSYGVGWLNNPMNPRYPAGRPLFLRTSYGDAATPQNWSYEEKVMGWAETPLKEGGDDAYSTPAFGNGSTLTLPPGRNTFCRLDVNNCDPSVTSGDACHVADDYCFWHGTSAAFADCTKNQCSKEHLGFALGAAEPGVKRVYDRDCETFTGSRIANRETNFPMPVVYDLNETSQYALGCPVAPVNGGKFTLRLGSPAGSESFTQYNEIDLHQLGAGYNGHMWFTHIYPEDPETHEMRDTTHQVVGTWTPAIDLAQGQSFHYEIVVHLPGHGGEYASTEYDVFPDTGNETEDPIGHDGPCVIGQSTGGNDRWEYLGNYVLKPGARVELKNMGGPFEDGTVDVAYDAMAFVPTDDPRGGACGDWY